VIERSRHAHTVRDTSLDRVSTFIVVAFGGVHSHHREAGRSSLTRQFDIMSSDTSSSSRRIRYTFSVYSANSILTDETVATSSKWDEPKLFPASTVDSLLDATSSLLNCTPPQELGSPTPTSSLTDSMKPLDNQMQPLSSEMHHPEQEVEVEYQDPRLFASYSLLRQKRDPPPSAVRRSGRTVPQTAAEI
jgi:hypothetical protein